MFFNWRLIRRVILSLVVLAKCFLTANAYFSDNSSPVSLEKIIVGSDSVIVPPVNKTLVFDYRHNDILFKLAPDDSITLSFILEGYDKKWGLLQTAGIKEYTNLPAGKYNFLVRYNDKNGNDQTLSLLSFNVLTLWYFTPLAIIMYLCLAGIIIWVAYSQLNFRFAHTQHMLEQIINKRTEDLIVEKEKTETLLANVLPKITASEIMETGKATKIKYNFVTVLFSDIQGFTQIAEEMNPEVLIDELDKFFFHFDSVVESLGIEKIKTIGDAYMCAGGIPERNRTNPVEVILAALEMQDYMRNLKESSELTGMKYWDIRIGIHTGTVVAGVVGHKKLTYDIWGDTVNTASRMESSGEAGKINISGTTYEFVKDFFICEHRGKMPVKYKGELDMYFVKEIMPELRSEDGKPNNRFRIKMQLIKLQDIEEAVLKMFENEAPPDLYFHNSSAVKSISSQVDLLSTSEKVPEEELINLKLAAIFLFSGYISDYENPVDSAFVIVEDLLPKYGFHQTNIEEVRNLISNSFKDRNETLSDYILHDARYDYLGRVDFIKLSDKLLKEESAYGKSHRKEDWVDFLKKLLIDHDFKTSTARILRSVSSEDQLTSVGINYN